VFQSAFEVPVASPPPAHELRSKPPGGSLSGFARRHLWWAVGLAVAIVAGLLVAWARTRPSYDAYGWLVWGYQTLHASLDLGGAPSWKPLPYLFTVPFALFGGTEMWLWMFSAVALSLAGSVFAARIAYRLTLAGPGSSRDASLVPESPTRRRRYAALTAGAFAGVALLGTEDYMHYILSVQSDPVIVTCTLGAIDAHLGGRRRWAFAFALLASLGRPEAWPWLALYSGWAWLRVPRMRWMIVAGAVVLLFMWFGIPTITNGRPFVSAQLAFNSPRELKTNQVLGTIGRFTELLTLPIWLAALAGVAIAAIRRDRVVLGLAVIVVGWVIVEIAFALHGWPALPRYMFEAGAIAAVLAGVAVGWVLVSAPCMRSWMPGWAGVPVVVLLVLALLPGLRDRVRVEHHDLTHERGRAKEISLLGATISALGGPARIVGCGIPVADVAWVSPLAYLVHEDVGKLGHKPQVDMRKHLPIVLFFPLTRGGWRVLPWHLPERAAAQCRPLHSALLAGQGGGLNRLARY
jgi:hypothetical protein